MEVEVKKGRVRFGYMEGGFFLLWALQNHFQVGSVMTHYLPWMGENSQVLLNPTVSQIGIPTDQTMAYQGGLPKCLQLFSAHQFTLRIPETENRPWSLGTSQDIHLLRPPFSPGVLSKGPTLEIGWVV